MEEILARLWLIVATSSSFETKDYPNCIVSKADLKTLLTAYEKEKETSHYIQSQLDIANAKLVEEKEKNKNARERIEYYLVENMRLNDFDERNKELRKLEKILEE